MFSVKVQIVNNVRFGRPHAVLVTMLFFFLSGVCFSTLKICRDHFILWSHAKTWCGQIAGNCLSLRGVCI